MPQTYPTPAGYLGVSNDSIPVTASDTVNDPEGPFRSIRSAAAGTVKVTTISGNTRVMSFLAGETRKVGILRVWANGGTADVATIEGMP